MCGRSFISVPRDATGPGFVYTIGLYERHRHPDLIVVGVPRNVGHWLLETMGARIEQGSRFKDNVKHGGILESPYHLAVRKVHRTNLPSYMGTALRHHGGTRFVAAQVFLPDFEDRLPWERGYQPRVPSDVRLLSLAVSAA
jgi:Domain of unknown function (DUF4262)